MKKAFPESFRDITITVHQQKTIAKRILVGMACFLLAYLLFNNEFGPITKWARAKELELNEREMMPIMRPLANQGKPDAIIWMSMHDKAFGTAPLLDLAKHGNTQAMIALARLRWITDPAFARSLINEAAEAGNETAIREQRRINLCAAPVDYSSSVCQKPHK